MLKAIVILLAVALLVLPLTTSGDISPTISLSILLTSASFLAVFITEED